VKAVVQRVSEASVAVAGGGPWTVGPGLVVLLGVAADDGDDDVRWLADKVCHLRIFDDDAGVMNRSVIDTGSDLLVVSQFTLLASTRKGNRPSYVAAARPETAIPLYERFVSEAERLLGKKVATGSFGARMTVRLANEGPVTILLDSKRKD
jgi:D-tyrosyl-tRNA(Tyr) deacylase